METIIRNFKQAHPVKQAVILMWITLFSIGVISLCIVPNHEIKSFLLSIIGNGVSLQTVLIFWGLFILRILFFFPMSVLLILAPLVFGNLWLGIFFSGLGQVIGASFGFFLARYYGQEFIETKSSKLMSVVNHKLENYGTLSVILLRIIPVFPYDLINFASGISRMKFSAFLGATALSVWPDCVLYGLLGGSFHNPKAIFFAISFALIIFAFLWYLKTHPKFKDFFIMTFKKKYKKLASSKAKIQKKIQAQVKRGFGKKQTQKIIQKVLKKHKNKQGR